MAVIVQHFPQWFKFISSPYYNIDFAAQTRSMDFEIGWENRIMENHYIFVLNPSFACPRFWYNLPTNVIYKRVESYTLNIHDTYFSCDIMSPYFNEEFMIAGLSKSQHLGSYS